MSCWLTFCFTPYLSGSFGTSGYSKFDFQSASFSSLFVLFSQHRAGSYLIMLGKREKATELTWHSLALVFAADREILNRHLISYQTSSPVV